MIDVAPHMLADVVHVETWNTDAFRNPLWQHYHRKCYLCERPIHRDFEVDHRVPQNVCHELQLSDLIHCSVNLLPACGSCNVRRQKSLPAHGSLLTPGYDPHIEARLHQRFILDVESRAEFAAADPTDIDASNTAAELQRLHSPDTATTEPARGRTEDLLDAIEDHYLEFIHPLVKKVQRGRRRNQLDPRLEDQLVLELTRAAPFTMLMHSVVVQLAPELLDVLDRALGR